MFPIWGLQASRLILRLMAWSGHALSKGQRYFVLAMPALISLFIFEGVGWSSSFRQHLALSDMLLRLFGGASEIVLLLPAEVLAMVLVWRGVVFWRVKLSSTEFMADPWCVTMLWLYIYEQVIWFRFALLIAN